MKSSILNFNSKARLIFAIFFVISGAIFLTRSVVAITNIDSTNRWAWNDVRGWIDLYSPLTASLTATKLTGWGVFSDVANDFISFDCADTPTPPGGSICGAPGGSNYFVSHDGAGGLAGWAWNDTIGWISFCGNGANASTWNGTTWICPASPSYRVTVNSLSGDFSGYAWSDMIGWISFNCADPGICGTSNYKVNTIYFETAPASGYVISNTYDTGVVGGAAYNSIVWQGTLSPGGAVKFQLATSDVDSGWGSGSADYLGPGGSSIATDVYTGLPNETIQLVPQWHNNKRYYRYKMYVEKAATPDAPVVTDVVVNWSP